MFLHQKELTAKVYNTKRSSIKWFISSILRDEETFARTYRHVRKRRGKWSDAHIQQPITVKNERTGFLPELKRHEFQKNETKLSDFYMNAKKKKDFINVRRKQLYNKHLIRRLNIRLVKIPNHIGWPIVQ